MKNYTIGGGANHGTTIIRAEGCKDALVYKAPLNLLGGMPPYISYNVPALYKIGEFPKEIQEMILLAEKAATEKAEKAKKAATEKAATEASVAFTVVDIHGSRCYGKNGGYKVGDPTYDLCLTAGNRYRSLIYKGFKAAPRGAEYTHHFPSKEELLSHYGVVGNTIPTKNPGSVIGRAGENIKALSAIAGRRLKVVKG